MSCSVDRVRRTFGASHLAKVGLRPHYYSDRGEDALTMTTKHLTSAAFQSGFQRLKAELRQKLVGGFRRSQNDRRRDGLVYRGLQVGNL